MKSGFFLKKYMIGGLHYKQDFEISVRSVNST